MPSQREDILKSLHTAATDIQRAESVETACERTVEAAEGVLELEMCSVLLHEDGWLEPVAMSSGAPPDGARRMRTDQGLAGKTFQTQDSYLVDEIEADDDTDPAKPDYRSGMSVPIGAAGVFQAVSTEPAAFDDSDIEFAELLVAHTARTIDRIRYERELREQQATLQRQNDRLEAFVDVVSHDLRNPLNVATGRLELAQAECTSDHLDAVARALTRMEALIDALLTLAREGRPVEEPEAVELDAVIESCWATVETADATLVAETDQTVLAAPDRVKQLFENLFRNAVEHGGDGVTITVGDLDDPPGFYVADDGPGIPSDKRGDVFAKGYSTQDDGTGFGLAIVEEIVEAHDWAITVTESAAGGARFEITGVERARESVPQR